MEDVDFDDPIEPEDPTDVNRNMNLFKLMFIFL
jgi:hypothetical protein